MKVSFHLICKKAEKKLYELIKFCTCNITKNQCTLIWKEKEELRKADCHYAIVRTTYGRIMASIAYQTSKCKLPGYIQKIFRAYQFKEPIATQTSNYE